MLPDPPVYGANTFSKREELIFLKKWSGALVLGA
jgi:hypothetical protein